MSAPDDTARFQALQWAAMFRGASDSGEAIDWMAQRGLVDYDEQNDEVKLTPEGIERGDALYDALNAVPQAEHARKRTGWLLLAGLGFLLWRRRRSRSTGRPEAR